MFFAQGLTGYRRALSILNGDTVNGNQGGDVALSGALMRALCHSVEGNARSDQSRRVIQQRSRRAAFPSWGCIAFLLEELQPEPAGLEEVDLRLSASTRCSAVLVSNRMH
jgi:hypothetical protein